MCHACCRAIICLPSFISHRPAICYLYTELIVYTLHPYSHYCFLCMVISDSDAVLMNAEKKRQKSLQCNSKISTKRFSALKDAVPVVGDSKHSSAVDDLNCHTQPSQVLALSNVVACCIWCLACIASNLVKLHLLTLHIIPLIMTCVPIFYTYYVFLLTMFLHQPNVLVYLSSITYDETVKPADYCEKRCSFKECSANIPT